MSFFRYLKKVLQTRDEESLSKKTDNELIQTWIENKNENVYMELTYRYENIIFNYVSRRVKDKSSSQDLVQECFLAFLKTPENFLNKDDVKSYFLGIARHVLIKNNKNNKQDVSVSIDDREATNIANEVNILDETLWNSSLDLVTKIMDEFSERDRHICDLYYKEGYKPSEIAKNLDMDSKKIRNIIYNCETYIKKCLAQKLGKNDDR
ncbi:MAG: sigma-70 family RNA polymerase sigma factor [Acidobacteria bacterium]|nr:sigma-70 family RNA polymerase sigma factor [Acidobacteriota bacterium]